MKLAQSPPKGQSLDSPERLSALAATGLMDSPASDGKAPYVTRQIRPGGARHLHSESNAEQERKERIKLAFGEERNHPRDCLVDWTRRAPEEVEVGDVDEQNAEQSESAERVDYLNAFFRLDGPCNV